MLRQTGREIGVKGLVGARGEIVGSVESVEGRSDETRLHPGGFIDLDRGWHLC